MFRELSKRIEVVSKFMRQLEDLDVWYIGWKSNWDNGAMCRTRLDSFRGVLGMQLRTDQLVSLRSAWDRVKPLEEAAVAAHLSGVCRGDRWEDVGPRLEALELKFSLSAQELINHPLDGCEHHTPRKMPCEW